MSQEASSQSQPDLASIERALRDALAKHGPQDLTVLSLLEQYAAALHTSGDNDRAAKMEERAAKLRALLKIAEQQSSNSMGARADIVSSGAEPVPETISSDLQERHLYNSRGQHIATEYKMSLYTPSGKNIGRWSDDLSVFLDRKGRYLGEIIRQHYLVREHLWSARDLSFGDRGNEGDRAGWMRQPDMSRIELPQGYEDVALQPTG